MALRRVTRIGVGLLLAALAAAGTPSASAQEPALAAPVPIPDTPAGRRLVGYYASEKPRALGFAGCATVEVEPAQKVLYSDPVTALPDPERTSASSIGVGWGALGVEPRSYDATARVGARTGLLHVPKIFPGAYQVAWIPIEVSEEDRAAPVPRCD